MTIAFVLSGGGSLGAVQVGMLQALAERDVRPDLLIGTSVGAINAAYVAGHGTGPESLERLAEIWRRLRRQEVFPLDPLRHVLAVAGARPSLCSNRGLKRLLDAHLTYRNLEDAPLPVHIVTTNLLSGQEVLLSTGDTARAVLASTAIPGVFPAVDHVGCTLVDGGISDNAAISQAVALGADEVYILPAGFACALERPPRTALGTALQALTLLIEQRLVIDVAQFVGPGAIKLLPPLCPVAVSATDFSHGAELIERSRAATGEWIDSGGPSLPAPSRFLSLHHHDHTRSKTSDMETVA
ncbi:MAG TPA: patatin-like phospholipase family protein [Acidimicrobiia bacterium]|jgi:NTE family protein|nr:patatin-like phospholipase family protein [Acidimicrobiia bacterium]